MCVTHAQLLERIAWWRREFPRVYAEVVRRIGERPENMEDDSGLLWFDSFCEEVCAEQGCMKIVEVV